MSVTPSIFDPAVIASPYDAYRTLREQAPVAELGPGMFVVTRYDDVVRILADPDRFSSRSPSNPFAMFGPSPVQAEIDEILGEHAEIPTLLNNDPPEQTRIRSLVSRVFTPRRADDLRPRIRTLVDETARRWIGSGTVELASEFARPLPSAVTAELLGAPPETRDRLTFWADEIMSRTTGPQPPDRQLEVAAHIAEMARFFQEMIHERRDDAREDLVSLLLAARLDDGSGLTDAQIVNVVETFLVGGNETTTFLLTSTMHRLATDPDLMGGVRGDPASIPPLVEEMLRLESPAQGLPRWTTVDVEIADVRIPRGSMVLVMFAAANRDPAVFDAPDELFSPPESPTRARHLAFGHGAHFCLGAHLARAEMVVALESLVPRMTDLRLDPAGVVERSHNPLLRGLTRLDLVFLPNLDAQR